MESVSFAEEDAYVDISVQQQQHALGKKDFILANHSQVKMLDKRLRQGKQPRKRFQLDKVVEARIQQQKSVDRIRKMNESTYGLTNGKLPVHFG